MGFQSTRQLLDICPDPDELFSMNHQQLTDLFGTHTNIISAIEQKTMFHRAEQEVKFAEDHHIKVLFFSDPEFPQRLNDGNCNDAPVVLYVAGNCNLNPQRSLSVVGSRKATDYGKSTTHRILGEMAGEQVLIVSGLAYGIDTAAHRGALEFGLPTVAVMAHGLDTIYPAVNRTLAEKIVDQGGAVLTEYISGTALNAAYFPARNRIVAALSDAALVVEAAEKGGALITASIAGSYHREVFTIPGRLDDPYSQGCINLIANNKASLIRNADDLFFLMGWKQSQHAVGLQTSLFVELDPDEQTVVDILNEMREATLDDLAASNKLPLSKIASALLSLELKKVIRCLPGKIYKIV